MGRRKELVQMSNLIMDQPDRDKYKYQLEYALRYFDDILIPKDRYAEFKLNNSKTERGIIYKQMLQSFLNDTRFKIDLKLCKTILSDIRNLTTEVYTFTYNKTTKKSKRKYYYIMDIRKPQSQIAALQGPHALITIKCKNDSGQYYSLNKHGRNLAAELLLSISHYLKELGLSALISRECSLEYNKEEKQFNDILHYHINLFLFKDRTKDMKIIDEVIFNNLDFANLLEPINPDEVISKLEQFWKNLCYSHKLTPITYNNGGTRFIHIKTFVDKTVITKDNVCYDISEQNPASPKIMQRYLLKCKFIDSQRSKQKLKYDSDADKWEIFNSKQRFTDSISINRLFQHYKNTRLGRCSARVGMYASHPLRDYLNSNIDPFYLYEEYENFEDEEFIKQDKLLRSQK